MAGKKHKKNDKELVTLDESICNGTKIVVIGDKVIVHIKNMVQVANFRLLL